MNWTRLLLGYRDTLVWPLAVVGLFCYAFKHCATSCNQLAS